MTFPYLGRYCPTCKQDCLPIRGRCGWCDTRLPALPPIVNRDPGDENDSLYTAWDAMEADGDAA